MTGFGSFEGVIPVEELQGVEEDAFGMLHMDREMVMDQFDDIFEDTDKACRETLVCKGMYESFAIAGVDGDEVHMARDVVFKSQVLADALHCADELVLYAVAVHGYEELAKNPANSMFDNMFYDAWGVGYSMACHRWIKAAIDGRARECGRYSGRSWIPGEGVLDMSLQRDLFGLLDASLIGIELPESGLMRPTMTVSGMKGISDSAEIETLGLDVVTYH